MIETHPFGSFVPPNTKYLILGSFTGKIVGNSYDWFYGTPRNQFWPILSVVYGFKLDTRAEKQNLFNRLEIAITDIILSCERRADNNLDMNLINIVYNTKAIEEILKRFRIKRIFFSSRFVETRFKRDFKALVQAFPTIELVTLPSPSPRYAAMSKDEKIKKYKQLLPKL